MDAHSRLLLGTSSCATTAPSTSASRAPLAPIDPNQAAAEAAGESEGEGSDDLIAAEPDGDLLMSASVDECVAMCFHQWARTDTKEWLHVLLFEVADGAVELQSEMEDHFIRYAAMATACKQKVLGMGMFSGSTRGVYAAQDLYLRAYEEAHRELESICCATTETCCTWSISPYHALFQVQM